MSVKAYITRLTVLFLVSLPLVTFGFVRGIYITQPTLESTEKIKYLIDNAKASGINTFVIDYYGTSKRYRQNIALVKQNNLRFVARITMFPYGALESQVRSPAYLEKRYRLIRGAVALGADAIQMDYIRYRPTQHQSSENAQHIYNIVRHVREMLKGTGVELQVDIFGVAAHREAKAIGQNAPLFANAVDAICPMVYPSHYEPFRYYAVRPYQTVYNSLTALRAQLQEFPDVKIYAYIELYNYRYPLGHHNRVNYILAEMRAVRDAKADGWYAWSANNKYNILFAILQGQ